MAKQELPEDVLFHILLGLPVISLLRFKTVCKSWCAHINNSTFINEHLHHHIHRNNKNDIIIAKHFHNPELYLLSGELYKECFQLDLGKYLPLEFGSKESWSHLKLVASCNGIICLSCTLNVEGVALWNPATKQLTRLQSEVAPRHRGYDTACFGFGYDVKADDYKVVIVNQFREGQYSVEYNRAEMYSLQTDSWRTVNANIPANCRILNGVGACNGHYYCWLLENYSGFQFMGNSWILHFDFSAEVFKTTPLPYLEEKPDILDISTLTSTGDNITIIHFMRTHFDIWLLKEFGVKESWTKLYAVEPERLCQDEIQFPTGFLQKAGLVVMHVNKVENSMETWHMALFDPNTHELTIADDRFRSFQAATIYNESLVSIKRKMHPPNQKKEKDASSRVNMQHETML